MTTYLVTGGTGFLGRHLLERLVRRPDAQISVLVRGGSEGTRRVVELAGSLGAGCLHHVSSVAVAGGFAGTFTEDMFDAGQELPSPYHATKYEAERLVRQESAVPWRVYGRGSWSGTRRPATSTRSTARTT